MATEPEAIAELGRNINARLAALAATPATPDRDRKLAVLALEGIPALVEITLELTSSLDLANSCARFLATEMGKK